MLKIKRENIWDLVGSGYHSCVITTYSFDFYYFERSAMRVLRSKGISNISIFVDNNIFQGILGKIGSCSNSRVYALNPMSSKGCFHPKVYMFFGDKQGLLIVGSGNLTSSGHGKNDEVWGAFHFDINEKNNEQIFSDAWLYFQTLSSNIKGFSVEKFNWIKEYTPWLESLPVPNTNGFQSIDEYNEVAFLANDAKGNIYRKLIRDIPNDEVQELTVIAPYFDLKGKILEAFSSKFKNAKINVLLDDINGILPFKLKDDVADNMCFYHWKNCCVKEADKETYKRLHAKIFHFILADNTEYCLIGSANASVAAFGNENYSAINDEVSLLFKSSNQDFLSDLGIKINPVNVKKLSDFENGLEEDDVFVNEFLANNKYNIDAINKEVNVLSIYLNALLDSNSELALYNTWGELVSKAKLTIKNNHYSATISEKVVDAIYACIIDSETSEILSNKQIIQDVIVLSKTNPDPQKRVLDVLFNV